ncbi:MAG: class I SAM-dependent methyltransferase [Minisyncoccales bacterium]
MVPIVINDLKKQIDFPLKKFLDKSLGEKKFNLGLDLGCGNGRSAFTFMDKVKLFYCLDINQNLLKEFKKNPYFNHKKFILQCFDGKKIPFPDNFFDFVSMITVYEHLKEPAILLKEVFRVLKKEGYFLIQNDTLSYHFLSKIKMIKCQDPTHINMKTPNFLEKQLRATGWRILKKAYFPFYRWGRVFEKIFPSFLATKGTFLCKKIC